MSDIHFTMTLGIILAHFSAFLAIGLIVESEIHKRKINSMSRKGKRK